MNRRALSLLTASLVLAVPACKDDVTTLRAYRAESPDQLIGGDVAMARVGDFILENDRIRIAVLDVKASPGPGIFGGTLVDADLQRTDARFRNGNGHDQLSEVFPFANLLTPRPDESEISIIQDGSDGESAVVRVTGEGQFILDALRVFQDEALSLFFGNLKTHLEVSTDYILEPGKPYVRMVSTARRSEAPTSCDANFTCDLDCAGGLRFDSDGCPVCQCSTDEPLPLENFRESQPLFLGLLGDSGAGTTAGIIGGDFVFFGGQNNLFAPQMGFDETRLIFDQLFLGRDTFTQPLSLDFMAAAGGEVSYGYFTVNPPGETDPRVLVPLITSSTTAFTTAARTCSEDNADDEACDQISSWSWERYFAVGQGDIASVADIVYAARQTPVGTLKGVVLGAQREAEKNAHVFVFNDPDPTRTFASVNEIADANYRANGTPGLLNAIDADVGLDPVEDGDFHATMPPGTYLVVATNEDRTSTSEVSRITIVEGETVRYAPVVPAPARLTWRITDSQGRLIAAKLTLVSRDADGELLDGDGLRRPYLGEGRLGAGVRHLFRTATGEGSETIEPGRYRLFASHGTEYSVGVADFEVGPGEEVVKALTVVHEVDTDGWIAGDFHLHQEPSHDSGLKLDKRVTNIAAEGLDLGVSTDHDVVTDLRPTVRELGLQDVLQTSIGVEMTTIELGHFIAFPLAYDALTIPDHGAPDWSCQDGPGLLRVLGERVQEGTRGVRIMAHPRDGFFGYVDQLGVNPYTQERVNYDRAKVGFGSGSLLELEAGNVLFRQATCDWDAMEVFNAKRFDLMRIPTNRDVIVYNRCRARIDAAAEGDYAALEVACPELTGTEPLTTCDPTERFFDCTMRYRRRLAFLSARSILERTPAEQDAIFNHVYNAKTDGDACDPAEHPGDLPEELATTPCTDHDGVIDDWMFWLQRGLNVTITAASDSHGDSLEPGTPRTLVRNPATRAPDIDAAEVAEAMVDHRALPTYGPVIDVSIGDAIPGDVAKVTAGQPMTLNLRVQTASWFGVDRIEVYVSGKLVRVLNLGHGPEVVVDWDAPLELTAPEQDGFVSVIAMGLEERNLLRPIYLDISFGELQLSQTATLAFGAIPALQGFFTASPVVPDFYPVFPMAITNAILLDVDGDGKWTPPGEFPPFCPQSSCEPGPDAMCPSDQVCLDPEHTCGYDVKGQCLTGVPGLGTGIMSIFE
ncbi:MAG: PHP domain-containing protein [Deltaproteobacteria bacterium]|nr:PHP domain-containing protein [Deltaproteobacteria bacterium]